jgi:hypothetical protein
MRAHFGTDPEGEFHFVQCPLQIRGLNGSNNGAAFVAFNRGLIAVDDAAQTAATVRRSEIGMRYEWAGHYVKTACYFSVVLTRPKTLPARLQYLKRLKFHNKSRQLQKTPN